MTLVRAAAGKIASAFGRESRVIRGLRPAYEIALNMGSLGRGIGWTVNGATCRIDARQRNAMPRIYEPQVAEFLAGRVKPGDTCLDIGAHVGVYVLQFARWSGPDGRIHAFEPNPDAARVLQRHVRMNDLVDRVTLVKRAVSEAPGQATLHAQGSDGMSRLEAPNPLIARKTRQRTVEVTSIDEYCAREEITPDWILIDIEGFEMAALSGGRDTIARLPRSPEVIVEMHPSAWQSANTSRPAAEALLDQLGRRPVPISGQQDPLGEHGVVYLETHA